MVKISDTTRAAPGKKGITAIAQFLVMVIDCALC